MFTIVSEVNGDMHVRQYDADNPLQALRDHIAILPVEPLIDFTDEQITALQKIASGDTGTELIEVDHCQNTFLWTSNLWINDAPQPITCYIIGSNPS